MMDPNPPPPPPRQQPSFTGSETLDMTSANKNAQNDTYTTTNNRGSIAERRAVKCGFNADRINTARFRSITPLTSPATAVRSPCITIPPGISPTALLDSPIMLPNSQLSPTTGSFPFPLMNYGNSVTPADMDKGNNAGDFQEVGSVEQSMDFEFPVEFINAATTESYGQDSVNDLSSMITNANFSGVQVQSVPEENVGRHHPQAEEEKGKFPATGIVRSSEDGYNWRKYGQKQVKGSEYPRSYYKCTHQNCQVKKKIERSHDGQITEIIYKGTHNHPKPQPSRRAQQVGSATSSFDEVTEMDECSETCVKVEVGSVWKNSKNGLERTSSASVVTDVSDPLSTTHGKCSGTFESAGTPELSSTLVSNDDDDDGATQGSISLSADADIEESESKRRKVESCFVETSLSSRAVREPRVVVQIESEVDILDDGYRWRKYGQKVVKGNPNPRSYYKCTSAGCTVRKHVERASHNLKFVITTYEGKHNHEVPAAKNSNNLNASGGNFPQVTANAQPALTLARSTNRTKPENQLLDYAPGFDRKPVLNNEYSRPDFPGNFGNQMKLGASSIYPLKFHPLQHTMSYSSMEFNHGAANHPGSIASLVPDFQISLPSSLHTSANLSMAGVDFNYNGKPISQGHPFLSGHQLVLPKQEQRDDDHFDAARATIEHVNGSLPSSVYQSIMGNFPS